MKTGKRLLALWLVLLLMTSACSSMTMAAGEEDLPVAWDLSEVYPDTDAWQADFDRVMELLDNYDSYRGTLNTAENIYAYLDFAYLSELTELQNRLYMYAALGYYLDPTDPVFNGLLAQLDDMSMQESILSAFADPEIYELTLEEREEIFADPLFDDIRYALRAYTDPNEEPFSEEVSQILATLSIGQGYAETTFTILDSVELPDPTITMPDGTVEPLTDELYYEIIYSGEYDEDFLAEANEIILTKPVPFIYTLTTLLEENAKQAYASALINDYDTTREAAMDAEDVDPVVYDMLIEAAHEGAADYQRYLDAHARGLGLEEQRPYDMGTYVSDFYPDLVEYDDAVAEVEDALAVLGGEYLDTFKEIIASGHVDVYPTDTKETGAFETLLSPDTLPWVLFNYLGYTDDVSTIAHEMGHAVYSTYAARNQNAMYAYPTIFTQEVASTTNELIYYTYKMENAADEDERLFYLENMLSMFSGTFFTQMLYAEFEDYMYEVVESGAPLDPEDLGDKWVELFDLYRGSAVEMFPDARYQWATIPHFYYVYYVYQYASSVAYAASIAERITTGEEGATEDYLAFLKAGGSAAPADLLAIAGIDPLEEGTYAEALAFFSNLVDEYEELVDAKLAA